MTRVMSTISRQCRREVYDVASTQPKRTEPYLRSLQVAELPQAGASEGVMRDVAGDTLEDVHRLGRTSPVNILIVGPMAVSDRGQVLRAVRRQRGRDVFHAQSPAEFVLPDHGDVILVLDDASQLSRADQLLLLEWVGRNRLQIVSFASRSLYDMVSEQSFIDRLYYQLNTVCVIVGDS